MQLFLAHIAESLYASDCLRLMSQTYWVLGDLPVLCIGCIADPRTYVSRCGDPDVAMSSVFSFKTGKTPSAKAFPVTFALTADVGQTTNSSWTLQQLAAHEHDVSLQHTYLRTYQCHLFPCQASDWAEGPVITCNETPACRHRLLQHGLNSVICLQVTIHVGGGLPQSLYVDLQRSFPLIYHSRHCGQCM